MSTTIKDEDSGYGPHYLEDLYDGWVNLYVRRGEENIVATVPRADFLAAVESELRVRLVATHAIVIDRSEVHPVETTEYKDVHTCDGYAYGYNREKTARRQALSLLAYAEYMDAHPRVDEAQVGALSEILHDATDFLDHPSADDLAHAVIATGRVTIKP